MIVNWLLTRRCNKRCSYCGLVQEPKCKEFKSIDQVNANELSFMDVYDSILGLNRLYKQDEMFHIFYGGEPFLKTGFKDFLKRVNQSETNIMYTVITNASLLHSKNGVIDTFEHAGMYKGLTVSLDPGIMEDHNSWNDVKNNAAMNLLKYNQDHHMTNDMVVECVITKENIKHSKKFFDMMKDQYPEVMISVSFYDYPKNEFYDFALNNATAGEDYNNKLRCYPEDKEVIKLKKLLLSNQYNIHLGTSEAFIDSLIRSASSTYYCSLIHPPTRDTKIPQFKTLTVDADGELRLCLRIAGRTKLYIHELFNRAISFDTIKNNAMELYEALYSEYRRRCSGCAWTCPMMDDSYNSFMDVAHKQ